MDSPEPLYRRIRRARKMVLKMSQESFIQFANTNGVDISRSTYQKLESGHLKYISDKLLLDLSQLLHLPGDELLRIKAREQESIHQKKLEGTYLKVGYSNSSPGHFVIDVVQIQYEPDIRDLRVYSYDERYQYIGTIDERKNLLYFTLEEVGKIEKLLWLVKNDVGLQIEALWGLCCAVTSDGTPYAYKIVLVKTQRGDPTHFLKDKQLNSELRYWDESALYEVLQYVFPQKGIANIYYKRVMKYLSASDDSKNPGTILATGI